MRPPLYTMTHFRTTNRLLKGRYTILECEDVSHTMIFLLKELLKELYCAKSNLERRYYSRKQ
jgi:hypothetical protein